jgi:2-dehydropantoate 2-reductase
MKFLLFGAGAIGAYIGGSLIRAGESVAFLERVEMADMLRRDGLALSVGGEEHRIPVPAVYTGAAEALRENFPDVAVFALKSYDTAAAVEPLRVLKDTLPPALCLQNGVENESLLETAFGSGRVIAGSVTSAVGRSRVGAVTLERKRGVGIARGHVLSRPLAVAFGRAGLNARLYPSPRSMKWSKLLVNLMANASTAILGMDPQAVYSDPRLFALDREMLRECLRVMRAAGIGITDLPGTPVRALAFAVQFLPAGLARPLLARAVGGGRGGKMPSFYLDLKSGRGKTEVDWLNGAVSRAGRRFGVPTPVNDRLTEILTRLSEGVEKRDDYLGKPEKLFAALPRDIISRIGAGRTGRP